MPVTRSDRVKAFPEDGEKIGLKQDTITKLVGQDIDTVDILRLCSLADIADFQLSMGQTLVLQQWVTQLNAKDAVPVCAPSRTSQTGDVTLHNLLGHLRKKDPSQRNQMSQRRPRSTTEHRDVHGSEICRNYNGSGCDRPVCRYSHSCLLCRVKGHSSASHNTNQTFRPQAPPFVPRLV